MRALLCLAALLLAACSPQPAVVQGTVPELDGVFEFDSLRIVNDTGETLTFDVYLATNFEQQRRGLMYVRHMPETTGMLFIYEDMSIRSMWMKNTYIPLDMVFARPDGTVSSVIANTEPQSLRSLASIEPVAFVLELNAGKAAELGVKPGDVLELHLP